MFSKTRKWRFEIPEPLQSITSPPTDLSAAAVSIESYDGNRDTPLALVAKMGEKGLLKMEITHRRAFGLKNSDAVIVGSKRIYIDGLDFYLYDLKPPEQSWERHLLRPFGVFMCQG